MEAFLNRSDVKVVEVPPLQSPADFDVKLWNHIYLTDEWVKKATKDNIPYPNEYFIVTEIYTDTNDKPTAIRICGSMGGAYDKIPWNTPNLIKSVC